MNFLYFSFKRKAIKFTKVKNTLYFKIFMLTFAEFLKTCVHDVRCTTCTTYVSKTVPFTLPFTYDTCMYNEIFKTRHMIWYLTLATINRFFMLHSFIKNLWHFRFDFCRRCLCLNCEFRATVEENKKIDEFLAKLTLNSVKVTFLSDFTNWLKVVKFKTDCVYQIYSHPL